MSEQPITQTTPPLERLAREQQARPVRDIEELRADVWVTDREVEEFLADWRASRDASLS